MPVRRPQPVEVVQPENLVAALGRLLRANAAHRARSSASTTGSIRSTPSTRSSRFSVPDQFAEGALEPAVVAERVQALDELCAQLVVDLDPLRARASCRRAASGGRAAGPARRRAARGRPPAGRRARRSARRSLRHARRRAARPTAGRAGLRPPPARPRGTRAVVRPVGGLPLPSNVEARTDTVSAPTRMLPWAAKHGPARPPAQSMHSRAREGRAAAGRVDDAELTVFTLGIGSCQPARPPPRRSTPSRSSASPSGP